MKLLPIKLLSTGVVDELLLKCNDDYRLFLKAYQENLGKANNKFSLRKFADFLTWSPSHLSEIYQYKQKMSLKSVAKIVLQLQFTDQQAEFFQALVRLDKLGSDRSKICDQIGKIKYDLMVQSIQDDYITAISEWYHFAILELAKIAGHKAEPEWIAEYLSIHVIEAQRAMQRLERLKMLKIKDGKIVPTKPNSRTSQDVPSAAIQRLHQQLLMLARNSLGSQDVKNRDVSAMIMAINKEDLPKAKAKLQEFRRHFVKDMQVHPEKNSLYCLSLSFFQLNRQKLAKGG